MILAKQTSKQKMETIYTKTIEAVTHGARFSVDLRNRTLRVNSKTLIDKGCYHGELGVERMDAQTFLSRVTELYADYRLSVPTEHSMHKRKPIFPTAQMEIDDYLYGTNRDVAQARLEVTVLMAIVSGTEWDDEAMHGRWFWQSSDYEELVLLREWFDPQMN